VRRDTGRRDAGLGKRGSMVSQTKRVSTFGKLHPCHADILCRSDVEPTNPWSWQIRATRPCQVASADQGRTTVRRGQRPREVGMIHSHESSESGHRSIPDTKDTAGKPDLPCRRSGAAKSGWVVASNRHLNYPAESVYVNAGGCPETDVLSSRGEKPGQRRNHHSSQRSGEPATRRRVVVRRNFGAD
jgi:hypothetical protein